MGTVKGAITNDSLVTTGLTVTGDYTQSARGELVLGAVPLKVAGKVGLAGDLDLSAAGTRPARTVTILDHTGHAPTTGAFKGLREGTSLELADTTYRISYRGGDGNDVVLISAPRAAPPQRPPRVLVRDDSGRGPHHGHRSQQRLRLVALRPRPRPPRRPPGPGDQAYPGRR